MTSIETVIGPVPVPTEVADSCRPMWDIGAVVAKTAVVWRFVEVWNVSPKVFPQKQRASIPDESARMSPYLSPCRFFGFTGRPAEVWYAMRYG